MIEDLILKHRIKLALEKYNARKAAALSVLEKQGGILDIVQDTLATDVWDTDKKIYPHIKQQILDTIYKMIPNKDELHSAYIIGSITSYQWTETSDIDVMVFTKTEQSDEFMHNTRKLFNGRCAESTRHPINYFFVTYNGNNENWQDSVFGVYNLITDEWAAEVSSREMMRQPEEEYYEELQTASYVVKEFENMVDRYMALLQSPMTTDVMYRLQETALDLIAFCKKIDDDRKMSYYVGWGTPRKTYQNIVYKALEKSRYAHYFEMFKNLPSDRKGFQYI